jgi:hypothetical protein
MHAVVANLLSRLNDEVFVYSPGPSPASPKALVTLTPGIKPGAATLEEVSTQRGLHCAPAAASRYACICTHGVPDSHGSPRVPA